MITYSAPASFNIGALTSPVNAPSRSQCRFCAATPMFEFLVASTTECSDVNGGATTISTSLMSLTIARNSFANAKASCVVLNIFQLAAMKGVRINVPQSRFAARNADSAMTGEILSQRDDAGELAAAKKFERCAAAGRDMRDAIRHASFRNRGDRIAAADDGRA